MKTSKGKGMLSVSVPEAVMPQFQIWIKLAQLRKQGADVAKISWGEHESRVQVKEYVRQVQEGKTEVCGTVWAMSTRRWSTMKLI